MHVSERGLKYYDDIKDTYGNTIDIHDSSSAIQQCVWMCCTDKNGNEVSLHLDVKAATQIIQNLCHYLEGNDEVNYTYISADKDLLDPDKRKKYFDKLATDLAARFSNNLSTNNKSKVRKIKIKRITK